MGVISSNLLLQLLTTTIIIIIITPWLKSASKLYSSSDHRLSAKLVPSSEDRECRVVSTANSYGHILDFLDRSRYYVFQVAPQLYSRGWVDPVPEPLLLRKFGRAENRTKISLIISTMRFTNICILFIYNLFNIASFTSNCTVLNQNASVRSISSCSGSIHLDFYHFHEISVRSFINLFRLPH
jgi:hypothetical protein